jgi:hypothetical protein
MNFLIRQLSRVSNGWNYLSTLRPGPTGRGLNRHAGDWNAYSRKWDIRYDSQYSQLEDEWNDDRTEDRKHAPFILRLTPSRWISSGMTVLGVELGGGK